MIKVTLYINGVIRNVIVPEGKTIRQVLEENGIAYEGAVVYVNALPIRTQGLDTKFSGISDELTHYIIEVKPDQLAEEQAFQTSDAPKAFLAGSMCVIISSLSADEIKHTKDTNPELLQLLDKAGEPCFALDIEDGYGSIKEYGAVYGSQVTREGKVTITLLLNPAEQDLRGLVQTRLGAALGQLARLERRLLTGERALPQAGGVPVCPIIQL